MKKIEVCFDDNTRKIIEFSNGIDIDSYLHLLAKEQNKIIDEVFEIKN